MASFLDNCDFNATSTGTGDFVVATAVTGHQTPASAGAVNAAIYRYYARSSDSSQWEVGYGAYTSASVTLARTTILFNSSGGATAINFSTVPLVAIVALNEDMIFPPASTTDNAALRADGTGGRTYQNSALIIADTTGALSRSGGGGIPVEGTNTNDDAASGYVGEYAKAELAYASRTSLTTATAKTVTSTSIPAGDFDVIVRLHYEPAGTTSITQYISSLSATNNTLDQSSDHALFTNMAANVPTNTVTQTLAHVRVSQASATTWYAVAQATFTVSTMTVWGSIEYRRAR